MFKSGSLLLAIVSFGVLGDETQALNQRFLDALDKIDGAKPHAAIESLQGLTIEIETPRIWLELARAHQKAGYHAKALDLYKKTLQKYPQMPTAVKRNVAKAISQSEQSVSSWQPSLSAGYLENPYSLPDDQTIYLFGGIPFEYEAPAELREGRAYLKYLLAATWSGADWYSLSSQIYYQDFTNADLDRVGGVLRSRFPVRGDALTMTPFFEYQFRDDNFDGDYSQPGIGLEIVTSPYSMSGFTASIKRSELSFDNDSQVDGFFNSLSLGRRGGVGSFRVNGSISGIAFEPAEKPQFNGYHALGLNGSVVIQSSFGILGAQVSSSRQLYNLENPIFTKRRKDQISNLSLTIPLDSLFPYFSGWSWRIGFEKRDSNINFYDSEITTAEIVRQFIP